MPPRPAVGQHTVPTSRRRAITASHDNASDPATQPPALEGPTLAELSTAVREVMALSARLAAARGSGYANQEGGDVTANGSAASLVRHVANYLAAAELARQGDPPPGLVDVGGGTGTLGAWLASRRGSAFHLVDADPPVRRLASTAFPEAIVHGDVTAPPQAGNGLVTAMEVIEHVESGEQSAFLHRLVDLVAPGGLLVLSTPDESGYRGGHSGYAPHVGVVDAAGLRDVLARATGLSPQVWRLGGRAFDLTPWQRHVLPLGNRAWARLAARAPGLIRAAERVTARLASSHDSEPGPRHVRVAAGTRPVGLDDPNGTGLLAAVRVPAEPTAGP